MTKVQNPIIGRARASAGGMTFTKNYDKNVMRSKPFEVKNPKTAAQVKQRDFFKQVQGIVATVSDEQLRSLFGDMPKAMSRRNALSKQVAAAYSMDGSQKVVDFSKLGAIGNGQKVTTPLVPITDGLGDTGIVWPTSELPGYIPGTTSPILVVFDETNNRIHILVLEPIPDTEIPGDLYDNNIVGLDKGFYYMTMPTNGSNVYDQSFGSFTIKTRAVKSDYNNSKGSADTDIPVTLQNAETGAAITLDFSNYDFNNLLPGSLFQKKDGITTELVSVADWIEGANNEWTNDLITDYVSTRPTFLNIMQGENLVEAVPVTVTIE